MTNNSQITSASMAPGRHADQRIYIVVPAYNEAICIGQVVLDLKKYYDNIVVVDDGSNDLTSEEAAGAGAVVIKHGINRGQGASVQTGIRHSLKCGATIIVTFDGDGQHQSEDIDSLVEPIEDGRADVSIGSRFLGRTENMPLSRRLILKAGIIYTYILHGMKLTDTHNGIRAFSRTSAEKLNIKMDRMAHADEILDQVRQNKLRLVEVPVRVIYTDYSLNKGQNSWHLFSVVADYLMGKIFR